MKALFISMLIGMCICGQAMAQYGGGYGGGRGGYGGGGYGGGRGGYGSRPSSVGTTPQNSANLRVDITNFPEIGGLTLDQHLNLSTIVTDEHKDLLKLHAQKQELVNQMSKDTKQKDIEKKKKKMGKIDEKMNKVSMKTDKKIQALLTPVQYKQFKEKEGEISFNDATQFSHGPQQNGQQNGYPGNHGGRHGGGGQQHGNSMPQQQSLPPQQQQNQGF